MLDTPLTDAEFDQLDEFLMSDEASSDTMDTSMLDDYLAAVASGPNLVMPDPMLRWVWDTENGEDSPQFKDNDEAQSIIGLILRHYLLALAVTILGCVYAHRRLRRAGWL